MILLEMILLLFYFDDFLSSPCFRAKAATRGASMQCKLYVHIVRWSRLALDSVFGRLVFTMIRRFVGETYENKTFVKVTTRDGDDDM